jgi:hypothetical protein
MMISPVCKGDSLKLDPLLLLSLAREGQSLGFSGEMVDPVCKDYES